MSTQHTSADAAPTPAVQPAALENGRASDIKSESLPPERADAATSCDESAGACEHAAHKTNGKPSGKAGAPNCNRNRTEHGIRGWLTIGSLPKGASYVRRIIGEFRRQIENGVLAVHGKLSPYHSALCQSAARHEARALLAGRWLKQQGDSSSLSERLQLLATIGNATDSRDKCLERLGLNRLPATESPWLAVQRMYEAEHDQNPVPAPDATGATTTPAKRLHENSETE